MKLASFCESIHASSLSSWHIRTRDEGMPLKFGGGIQTVSLCGRVKTGWDLEVPVTEHHYDHVCKDCIAALKEGKSSEPVTRSVT